MSAASAKYQMWGAELMRKREKENLRIQLGEKFYDYVEKCRKFLGWKQMKICEAIANSMNGKEIELKISEDRQKEVRRQLCTMAAGKAVIE